MDPRGGGASKQHQPATPNVAPVPRRKPAAAPDRGQALVGAATRTGDLPQTLAGADAAGRAAAVESLQTTIGNARVQRVLGPPSDADEAKKEKKAGTAKLPSGPGQAGNALLHIAGEQHLLPIEAFSFGASSPGRGGGGAPTGKAQMKDVVITHQVDDDSPLLIEALHGNRSLGDATIELSRRPPGDPSAATSFTYTLTGASLTSLQQSGGGGAPVEMLSIGFEGLDLPATAGKKGAQPSGPGAAGTLSLTGLPLAKSATFGIDSMSWGLTQPGAGGKATGKAQVQSLSITKPMDDYSHLLLQAFTNNRELSGTVAVTRRDEHGKLVGGSTLTIKKARIEAIEQSSSGDGAESLSFAFQSYSLSTPKGAKAQAAPNAAGLLAVRTKDNTKIDVPALSWSWGAISPSDYATGQASGKAELQDFALTLPSGPATVKFVNAIAANEVFKATTIIPKSGPGYSLAQARVSSVTMSSAGPEDMTQVTLSYAGMVHQSKQTQAGVGGGPEGMSSAKAIEKFKLTDNEAGPGDAGLVMVDLGDGKVGLPIELFSFGAATPAAHGAQGQATGKTHLSDLSFTRVSDMVSPQLLHALATNKALDEVELILAKAPGAKGEPLRYKLKGARLSSLQQSSSGGGGMESVSLAFAEIDLEGAKLPAKAADAKAAGGDASGAAGKLELPGLAAGDLPLPIESMGWGMSSPTDGATGQATGKPMVQNVNLTRVMDDRSPLMLDAVTTHKAFPNAKIISAVANDGEPQGTLDLVDAVVMSVSQSGGGASQVETISLAFEKFSLSERPASWTKALTGAGRVTGKSKTLGEVASPIMSWSWGASRPGGSGGGGGARGRVEYQDVSFVIPTGPATSQLIQALETNAHFENLSLHDNQGIDHELTGARVTSVLMSSAGDPVTTVSVAYTKLSEKAKTTEVEVDTHAPH